MTKSDKIRELSKQGLTTSEIARELGIRYQHAYNVQKQANLLQTKRRLKPRVETLIKPTLTSKTLLEAGFSHAGHWRKDEKYTINTSERLPTHQGVYAFSVNGVVQYVGLATMGLSKRLYFYKKPGSSQKTSIRLNGLIQSAVKNSIIVNILISNPEDLEWKGLPVHGCAGLELGLIKKYNLPWNLRSS